ncbi:hypothetical protein EV401DRAFT_1860094 [Pisolithus croceorrhizus]|nr:hypothetical protein EV401DRAFT_1860094 [Pisolithus croceorrhizus]
MVEEGKKYLRHLPSCQLKKRVEQFHSASAWTSLSTFTDVNVLGELTGNRIHRLEYIMSMEQACYRAFNELVFWLKPVERRIFPFAHFLISVDRVYEAPIRMRVPDIVTLSTTTEFCLPSPTYLALHVLCSEVTWMSGGGGVLHAYRKDGSEGSPAKDCSTADVLMETLALVDL